MTEDLTRPAENIAARLLIVDDELNIRSSLVRALSLLGYAVEEADSGHEALRLLEHEPYDLMVLDIHMPGMNGVEVMERARQLRPELLIIILTGHATLENAVAAVKLGAIDYLLKPVSINEIADTVTYVLQKYAKRLHQQRLVNTMVQALDSLRQTELPSITPPFSNEISKRFLRVHPLTLDCIKQTITAEDSPLDIIELTEGETAILAGLMTYPNQVLSCAKLVQMAWGQDMEESEAQNVVRPYISRLRRKIEAVIKKNRLIRTVRKRGYYLEALPK